MTRILTDFPRFPASSRAPDGTPVQASTVLNGWRWADVPQLLREVRRSDVLLIQDSVNILGFSFLFFVVPFLKKPIIAVDLILRIPRTYKQRVLAHFKRFLLNRIDHFVFYFKELRGYQKYFGIGPERSSYVAFKSNMEGNPRVAGVDPGNTEEYVFSAGRSLRDFDTLFTALGTLTYPAAIPKPNFAQLRRHGARFTRSVDSLPKNVELLPDDGSPASWVRNMARAKVVVVPTLRDNLCASGIGTYLDAMRLRKCVVISDGPGVSDLLSDEVIIVPPEDPQALAVAIQRAWEDAELRTHTASRGYDYVTALGGEPELMDRLLRRTVEWIHGAPSPNGHAGTRD